MKYSFDSTKKKLIKNYNKILAVFVHSSLVDKMLPVLVCGVGNVMENGQET